ncbi:hypothetical protein YC2023_054136 [Brassica napus]
MGGSKPRRDASCEPRVTVRGERERRWRKRSTRYTVEKSQTSELDGLIDLVLVTIGVG